MKQVFLYTLLIFVTSLCLAQKPTAFAGPDYTLCPDGSVSAVLGATVPATGGTPPYIYAWIPATGLSNASASNPTVTTGTQITYTLEVHDANDSIGKDIVTIYISDLKKYKAGRDTSYCLGKASNIIIGSAINASAPSTTFSWSPIIGLNNATAPNPIANPSVSTTYSLFVTKDGCTAYTGSVNINITMFNVNLAFHDTTIKFFI